MKNLRSSTKGWFLLFTLLLILSSSCTETASQSSNNLEAYVDDMFAQVDKKQTPGTAVMVVKDGEIILNKGYGMANLSHEIPITPTTVFDLASLSKQFCAYAISTLVEEGKIALDDDIRKHIPELPDFGYTITIDHLVHHISGIRDWTSTLPVAGWSFDDVISFDQILRMAFHQNALNYEPGTEYSYSNTGYNLLAEIIQRVEGVSFREWTDQNIFQPLGMEQTLFLDNHTETISNRAQGYRSTDEGTYTATPNNLMALGSSSMYSTTTDLSKWVMHLMTSGGKRPVVDRMFTRGVLNNGTEITYAFGLSVTEYQGAPWISHSGSWASFRTYLCILPEAGYGIVILNNHGQNTNQMARTIADYLLNVNEDPLQVDNAGNRIEVSSSVMNELTGTYKLGSGWYVEITFNDNQLWTQATNEEVSPMTPLSDSVFRIEAYSNRTMTFQRNKAGAVTSMTYSGSMRPKLDISIVTSVDPKDYVGTYESEELFTTYEVLVDGDQLTMKHFRHGTIELTRAWGEDYSGSRWFLGSVEFSRDNGGNVNGFYVTTDRARRQWFTRIK